jgi:hypothetical protein
VITQRPEPIVMYRHGSQAFTFPWLGGDGQPLNMTGYALSVVDVEPAAVAAFISAAFTDAETGQVRVEMLWDATWPDGLQTSFRLRATKSGVRPLSKPAFMVDVQ